MNPITSKLTLTYSAAASPLVKLPLTNHIIIQLLATITKLSHFDANHACPQNPVDEL